MDLVSIVMPVYNTREEWLRLSIESILNQSYTNIELIIVTDGPTDNSRNIVEEYACADSRIKLFHNEKNLGIVKTLNNGLQHVNGTYFARMDSDDIAVPDRIINQINYLENNELDLIGGKLQKIDENGNPIGVASREYSINQVKNVLPVNNCIPHPTWFGRSSILKELDGYREIKHCEDYDLLLRAYNNGIKLGMCNQLVLYYRINTSGITRSNSLTAFLSSRYLIKNISRIESINQKEINEKVIKKISRKDSDHFEKSVNLFQQSSNCLKSKSYLGCVICLIKGLFISRYAWKNFSSVLKVNNVMKMK